MLVLRMLSSEEVDTNLSIIGFMPPAIVGLVEKLPSLLPAPPERPCPRLSLPLRLLLRDSCNCTPCLPCCNAPANRRRDNVQ